MRYKRGESGPLILHAPLLTDTPPTLLPFYDQLSKMPCKAGSKSPTGKCANCSCPPPSTDSGAAVSLPGRGGKKPGATSNESTPLLWHTTEAPTATSGARYTSTDGDDDDIVEACPTAQSGEVCCRLINKEDERTLIDPDLARDCIVGLSDGLTVPFALTAGLSSVGSSRLVVLAGLAELVSGAISMGIGGFLSAQAELQHFQFHLKSTRDKVERSCETEIDRQIETILKDYGIESETCRKVARELRIKEAERRIVSTSRPRRLFGLVPTPVPSDIEDPNTTLGLTPFLLRVGSGLEPVAESRLYISALTIGLSYFLGGAIPLLPYVFIPNAQRALAVSVAVTGFILLVFGVIKQRVTGGEGGIKGYAWGAVSTLAVGGIAAGASWLLVSLLEGGGQ